MRENAAYAALYDGIVCGRLSPGERLVEADLAVRFREPRGAVRAAILRLAQDGLVVREPHRGAHVRRLSLDEAVEVLEARAALEAIAAGYAAIRRTASEAAELRSLAGVIERQLADGDLLAMSQSNAILHRRVLDVSRHDVARDVCARLHSQLVRFQFRTILAPGRAARSAAEHVAIVEAIAAADREGAEAAMRAHLVNATRALIDVAALDRLAS